MVKSSDLEDQFEHDIEATGWHAVGMEREHRFHPPRRWRFDFAWPMAKVAVEVEGGTWSGGRHTRGSGFAADAEKYNTATIDGWRVLRFVGACVTSGDAAEITARLLVRLYEPVITVPGLGCIVGVL